MPTWRSAPCSGFGTSTTAPSASSVGSRSASSGVRTGWSGTPASRRDAHPVVAREARERFRHLRVVVREDDDVLRVGRDAVGVVADAVDVAPQRERVAVGAGEHEARVRHPLLDPAVVGAAEEALRRAPVVDPGAVAGRVVVLGALPLRRGEGERRLQQRRLDVLAAAGALARQERGVDADGGEERGAHARPRRVGEDRSRARRPRRHAVGDLQVGQVRLVAVHVRHRAAEMTALLVQQTEAGGDQRVVAGAVAVRRVACRTPVIEQYTSRGLAASRVAASMPSRSSCPARRSPARRRRRTPARGTSRGPRRPSGRARRCADRGARRRTRRCRGTGRRPAARP